jgi:osmotically-inducible protein OsmY
MMGCMGSRWGRFAKTGRAGRIGAAALAACTLALASGCAALVVGGAVGTAMSATDRRTTGTQLEDQLIELKARNRVREVLPDRGNVSATSYNRVLLVTGEVPTEADKAAVEATVSKIDALKGLVNELAVREATAFSSRTNDTVLTSKVKATFVDARAFPPNAVKVVSERATVYLMGRVTTAEADKAAELARSVSGVMKVVKVFDPITQAEIDALPKTGPPAQQP